MTAVLKTSFKTRYVITWKSTVVIQTRIQLKVTCINDVYKITSRLFWIFRGGPHVERLEYIIFSIKSPTAIACFLNRRYCTGEKRERKYFNRNVCDVFRHRNLLGFYHGGSDNFVRCISRIGRLSLFSSTSLPNALLQQWVFGSTNWFPPQHEFVQFSRRPNEGVTPG